MRWNKRQAPQRKLAKFAALGRITMRVRLYVVGATMQGFIREGLREYSRRIAHLCEFELVEVQLKKLKSMPSTAEQCNVEGQLLQEALKDEPHVVLLDVGGKEYSSEELASLLAKVGVYGGGKIAFVVGGAYGFSPRMRATYAERISLSRLTVPHDLVRLLFVEQLYRALSINAGLPYHHG